MRLLIHAGAIWLSAAGCHSRADPVAMSCAPPADSLQLAVSAEGLAGTYRLKLVATEGARAGQSAEGDLRLLPYDSAMQAVTIGGIRDVAARYLLYGSTTVNLDAVGAVRPGDLESEDATQPGVLVIERKGAVTLRLGSEANRRDLARFDGGYTALRVGTASAERFAGKWASGVRTEHSAGYFCAVRVE